MVLSDMNGRSADSKLERAILETVAYADVFDYPLTAQEIHRYLHLVPAPRGAVEAMLAPPSLIGGWLQESAGFYMLPGRTELAAIRRQREALAERAWPRAVSYGLRMSGLPFVRMVALTGSLAMHNGDGRADFDYLLVAEPGRVWTCRAWTLLLARLAAAQGCQLCPNFILSADNLEMSQRNLYTAHELAQMVPLAGEEIYWRLRHANRWSEAYLPNAGGPPDGSPAHNPVLRSIRRRPLLSAISEAALRLPAGDRLEGWEMKRKIRKLSPQSGPGAEICFSADRCQGHFQGHGQGTLAAFRNRLDRLPDYRLTEAS